MLIEYEPANEVSYITLNRPAKLNAVTDEMVFELRAALERFDDDPDAKIAILRGSGRSFCSGADVIARQSRKPEEVARLGGLHARGASIHSVMSDFVRWKPVIAQVHGYAIGAGLGLALQCDLIVAASDAKFQITEVPRGLDGVRLWRMVAARTCLGFADDVGPLRIDVDMACGAGAGATAFGFDTGYGVANGVFHHGRAVLGFNVEARAVEGDVSQLGHASPEGELQPR